MSAPVSVVEKPPAGTSPQESRGDRQDCNGKLTGELERNSDKHPRAIGGRNDSNDFATILDTKSSPKGSNERTAENIGQKSESMDTSSSERPTSTTIRRTSTTTSSAATTTTTTTTASKFKEKRPEPLKLNPSLNQDIPLDLSVKSAGNVPSGTMSNIFNLGPTSHLTTLETPRIQWQDNDALLAAGTNLRSSSNMPHSASLIIESPSTCELQRAQILDRWSQSSRTQINQLRTELLNGTRRSCSTDNLNFQTNNDRHQVKNDKQRHNRLKVNQDDIIKRGVASNSKKNAISPLAMKSLSNTQNNSAPQNKFSYTNQQIASNLNDTQRSPTTIAGVDGKSLTPTSVANATANLLNIHLNSPTGLSQSPTASTFEATNSNNSHNHRSPYKSPSFSSFEHDLSPLDPLAPATYGQQQNNSRTSAIAFSSPTLNSDSNNNYHRNMIALQQQQQQNFASISSSATLNTPTLISPSQLKAGHLCFLQSPTLSPISSVFDLPSPFLMFPPSAQNQQQAATTNKQNSPKTVGSSQLINEKSQENEVHFDAPSQRASTNISKSCDTLKPSSTFNPPAKSALPNNNSSANDLSHLITSVTKRSIPPSQAARKQPAAGHLDVVSGDEVDMEIDTALKNEPQIETGNKPRRDHERPATVIPQICVSDHQPGANYQHASKFVCIADEQPICKPPTSPKLFCARTDSNRDERFESSSAPPYLDQRRARSKVKTIAADSCVDIALKNRGCRYEVGKAGDEMDKGVNANAQSRPEPARAQASTNPQQNRTWRPYPEIRNWFPSAGNLLQAQSYTDGSSSSLGVRSNSAEPTVYSGVLPKKASHYSSSVTNSNNATMSCCQHVTHTNNGVSQSNSAQQLHCSSLSDANSAQNVNSLNRTTVAGLSRPHMNAVNPNHQLQQQYASSHAYFQHQNHLQSTSAGELNRLTNAFSHQGPAIATASSYDAGSRQNFGHFNQPQAPQSQFSRQSQSLNQQGISSSLNRVDYILGENHQVHGDQKRHLTGNAACIYQSPLTRGPPHQTSVINLLCNNETCKRQMPPANEPHKASAANPLTVAQHRDLIADVISMNHATNSNSNSNNLNCTYQIDIESRSDSRSSSSLDYSSQFMDGGSRANLEASSNMTSKKYHCDQCSKSFTRSDMLTRHRRLHSGDRPFQCSECKQEFSRSDHLSTHMRTHTGEKPYKCKLCSYSACRKDMITRHLKVHSRNPHSSDCL